MIRKSGNQCCIATCGCPYHQLFFALILKPIPAYQISAKWGNAWLNYWWFNIFPRPVFIAVFKDVMSFSQRWVDRARSSVGDSQTSHRRFRIHVIFQSFCFVSKLERLLGVAKALAALGKASCKDGFILPLESNNRLVEADVGRHWVPDELRDSSCVPSGAWWYNTVFQYSVTVTSLIWLYDCVEWDIPLTDSLAIIIIILFVHKTV